MASQKEDGPMDRLVESFRSLLEESLVISIAGDYDLQTQSGYQKAENDLKAISQYVSLEEATGFDPAGTLALDGDHGRDDTSVTSSSRQPSHDRQTDSSSTGVSSSNADSSDSVPALTSFNNESLESQIARFKDMFDDMKDFTIETTVRKSRGNFQAALDALLNIQYLQSTGDYSQGIDGFFRPDDEAPKRKGKKKRKGKESVGNIDNFDIESTTKEVLERNQAKQLKHQDEIAFLADRIDMPYDQVSDIYYRKKCSSGAAAVEILDQYINLGITSQDTEGKARAKKLGLEYPKVPERFLLTLVQVTGSNASSSADIAALLNGHFTKNPFKQRLDLSHRLTPLPAEDLEGSLGSLTPGSKVRTPGSAEPSRPLSRASAGGSLDWDLAMQNIAAVHNARSEATAYASHLSRRGGAGSLYKQAAHVYRERAQDHARNASTMTSTAAGALVEQHSTATSIDLHGVQVKDGTRIARRRVQNWWDNLGEFRSRRAKERPFTVITGLGRHSAGGRSPLREAVAAALYQDGWKYKVETGKFVVSGVR